ncbi:MAG: CheD2 [uncultured bacterium]|nr:MAG: CheD2 [uncultured bacterium]
MDKQGHFGKDVASHDAYFLEPGFVYFSKDSGIVQTVLGSSVSVCLWDRVLKCGGISHFIEPTVTDPQKATPKFGNVSTIVLIKMMIDAGCQKQNVVAQVFGGSFPEGGMGRDIGTDNVNSASEILRRNGINVVSTDTGGSIGRKIIFDIATGHVAVLKVHKIRQDDWHSSCFGSAN